MAEKPKKQRTRSREREPSFETALERLEEIAARLESGDVPLEEAISLAEEGGKLSHLCERQLTVAAAKIEQLVERMGALGTEPLEMAAEDTGDEEA
jgi:exodeoxyribonuclease VII small subunit